MPSLHADYAWHARCLPPSYATRRRGPPASHEEGLFQWLRACAELQARWMRAGLAHPWFIRDPPMAQAWPRQRTGLGWAPPRRDFLMGGKIFGENMARKLSKHPSSIPCCLLAQAASHNTGKEPLLFHGKRAAQE